MRRSSAMTETIEDLDASMFESFLENHHDNRRYGRCGRRLLRDGHTGPDSLI